MQHLGKLIIGLGVLIILALVFSRSKPVEPSGDVTPTPLTPDYPEVQMAESAGHGVAIVPKRNAKEVWDANLERACELVAQDPQAALVWVDQLPLREDREAALKELLPRLAKSDPAHAMEAAWRHELGKWGGEAERAVLEQVASRWAKSDLNAAFTWAWDCQQAVMAVAIA